MKENAKRTYTVPQLEALDCKVEKGFAGSGGSGPQGLQGSGMENYGKGTGNEGNGYVFN